MEGLEMKAKEVIEDDLEYIYSNLKNEFRSMAGKKLLITGGGGILGYYLVQSILYWNKRKNKSHLINLSIYDNFRFGLPEWLRAIKNNKNLNVLHHDIATSLPRNMGDYNYIIHAASIASPTYYRQYPLETMDANVNGLRFLLDYCHKQKERHRAPEGFLFYSSSEIYGNPPVNKIPTPETYNGNVSCIGPRACYDESKRYGETLCINFAQQYHLPIKIVRPFNNYGPGLKISDKRVIADFARNILMGRDIIMFSDGSPTRTFCYISDAIIGYYKLLIGGRSAEPYNIGVEKPEISILNLAKIMTTLAKKLFNYKGKIVHKISSDSKYLVDVPKRRCPSINKARLELKYDPHISLRNGLKRSLIWYKENFKE